MTSFLSFSFFFSFLVIILSFFFRLSLFAAPAFLRRCSKKCPNQTRKQSSPATRRPYRSLGSHSVRGAFGRTAAAADDAKKPTWTQKTELWRLIGIRFHSYDISAATHSFNLACLLFTNQVIAFARPFSNGGQRLRSCGYILYADALKTETVIIISKFRCKQPSLLCSLLILVSEGPAWAW